MNNFTCSEEVKPRRAGKKKFLAKGREVIREQKKNQKYQGRKAKINSNRILYRRHLSKYLRRTELE